MNKWSLLLYFQSAFLCAVIDVSKNFLNDVNLDVMIKKGIKIHNLGSNGSIDSK